MRIFKHLFVLVFIFSLAAKDPRIAFGQLAFVPVVVTGDRVPEEFVQTAVHKTLEERFTQKKGTKVKVSLNRASFPSDLKPGQALKIPIQMRIWKENNHSFNRRFTLSVRNESLNVDAVSHLMVSNNPEGFKGPGILFREQFPDHSPVRLFYHHDNRGKAPYVLEMLLQNKSKRLSSVHVLEGIAGSDTREISVGASAAERYFSALKHNLGRVVQIEPEGSIVLAKTKLEPKGVASGVLRLSPLDASRPIVMMRVRPLSAGEDADFDKQALLDDSVKRSKGIYENPEITLESRYTVGGDYAFTTIGRDALLRDLRTSAPDYGNYGVFYKVRLRLINPSQKSAFVHVMFSPGGGPARGIFLINGKTLIKSPVVCASGSYPIVTAQLQPGETRDVEIETMPLGGSFYPVRLVAQP